MGVIMTPMSSIAERSAGVVVREAVPGDAEAIGRVRHASWQVAYSGLMPADYLAGLDVDGFVLGARRMLDHAGADGVTVYVAELGGDVCGFASVGPTRDDDEDRAAVGELYAIYLDPVVWRNGVGQHLQVVALDRLRAEGYLEATLWVLATNNSSRAFYERTGWHADGSTSGYTAGAAVLDEIRYRRAL